MGFQNVAINILAFEPDHWCKVDRLENFTYQQQVWQLLKVQNKCVAEKLCKLPYVKSEYVRNAPVQYKFFLYNFLFIDLDGKILFSKCISCDF